MKKVGFIFVALMGMVVASCNQSDELFDNVAISETLLAPVTVSVSGFSVEQGDFPTTRGYAIGDV